MKLGRPSVITLSVLQKLEWAFKLGATDKEACNEGGISAQTLYNYQAQNPDFLEQKEAWKSSPIFKARKSVVEGLERNPNLALKYLEKKLPEEFGKRTELQLKRDSPSSAELVNMIELRNKLIREKQLLAIPRGAFLQLEQQLATEDRV